MNKHMRKLIAALIVSTLAIGGGLWRANSGGGDRIIAFGPLRIISAEADTTAPAGVTAEQALALVTAKLKELDSATWSSPNLTPAWNVTLVPNVTQITEPSTGTVLYSRPWPITAWVAYVRMGASYAFGVVSDTPNLPTDCTARVGCEPPGTLLAVQGEVIPPVAVPLPPRPARVCPPPTISAC